MILNFSNPQPGFQNPFELHALNPKPNPTPEANPEHEPNFETEAELATMVEPAFEDPTLASALELIKGRPQPV
ncbi:hypothetical protein HanPSC8_Chr00c041g0802851 [Helianthus annuus]|nr:hypothetical protein HanPSC8_Chr00c041g0802851 [Helianthus annuus]